MTELLVIKVGDDYLRFQEDRFERCSMSKASVFPFKEIFRAREALVEVKRAGLDGRIVKLTIHEEPLFEEKP
mgnify:CR=1 FL=1